MAETQPPEGCWAARVERAEHPLPMLNSAAEYPFALACDASGCRLFGKDIGVVRGVGAATVTVTAAKDRLPEGCRGLQRPSTIKAQRY